MHQLFSGWLIVLAGLVAVGAFLAIVLRRREPLSQAVQQDRAAPRDSSLPPISPSDAQRIFVQARGAAMQRALGQADPRNPYLVGTRAHILWETEFCTVLMDLTH